MTAAYESRFFEADDGVRTHYRVYGPAKPEALPLVCLPGLTRNSADFDPLARRLASSALKARQVIVFDYRGRGLSDYDQDWRNYSLEKERADILGALETMGIMRAHWLGTSRGGLHIMTLATIRPDLIAAAVLNDIGPVLEPEGLARIKAYVGKPAHPKDRQEAIAILAGGSARGFTRLTDDEWTHFVTTTFGPAPRDLRPRYDPGVAHALDSLDLSKPLPNLWAAFDALRPRPLLAIRGANSDLLSTLTHAAMGARWPGCEVLTVADQAHAPLLVDDTTLRTIEAFFARQA